VTPPSSQRSGDAGPITSLTTAEWTPGALLVVATSGSPGALTFVVRLSGEGSAPSTPVESALFQKLEGAAGSRQGVSCAALGVDALGVHEVLVAVGDVTGRVSLWSAAAGDELRHLISLSSGTDWVRGVALVPWQPGGGQRFQPRAGRALLAACSQDRSVRVWNVAAPGLAPASPAADRAAGGLDDLAPRPAVTLGGTECYVVLDSVLLGHEDWVHSVAWEPRGGADGGAPALLSASMDRTMVRWERDADSGIWMAAESVGDAGPSSLGYYTGVFSPSGESLVANGYSGSLHLWRRGAGRGEPGSAWEPAPCATGHVGEVTDLAWGGVRDGGLPAGVLGQYLLSVSTDQTARLRARTASGLWVEASRPQVHGHDFSCVASIPVPGGAGFRYASGSEEKVVRVFESPSTVIESLAAIQGRGLTEAEREGAGRSGGRAVGGAVPALGLSQKAVLADEPAPAAGPGDGDGGGGGDGDGDGGEWTMDLVGRSAPSVVRSAPLEEHLAQNSLWPELQKLYGHGDDLFSLAADPRGALLASASVARSAHSSAIWLWDLASFRPVAQLTGPTLTVTQLRFSPSGELLVAAGRDRSLHLYRRGGGSMEPSGCVPRAHARVVWGADVCADDSLVASGSRDGTVRVWVVRSGGGLGEGAALPAREAGVTAVSWGPRTGDGWALAAGTEAGGIEVWLVGRSGHSASLLWRAEGPHRHSGAVKRLAWCDRSAAAEASLLASAGSDHGVRIFSLREGP